MGSYDDYDYSKNDQSILYIANLICALLSITGCIFILSLSYLFPNLRRLPFRMILYLTISDLGNSIGYTIPYYKSNILCQVQGYLTSYFSVSSIFWCACISHAIKSTLTEDVNIQKNAIIYFIISNILPLLSFLILIDIKEYKLALGWCWINLPETGSSKFYRHVIYRLITYYIPLVLVIILIIVNYIKVIQVIKRSTMILGNNSQLSNAMILKLRTYPIILVLCNFPVCALRLYSIWGDPNWVFSLSAGIGVGLNGALNSIVYGLTQEVKFELKRMFRKKKRCNIQSLVEIDK